MRIKREESLETQHRVERHLQVTIIEQIERKGQPPNIEGNECDRERVSFLT